MQRTGKPGIPPRLSAHGFRLENAPQSSCFPFPSPFFPLSLFQKVRLQLRERMAREGKRLCYQFGAAGVGGEPQRKSSPTPPAMQVQSAKVLLEGWILKGLPSKEESAVRLLPVSPSAQRRVCPMRTTESHSWRRMPRARLEGSEERRPCRRGERCGGRPSWSPEGPARAFMITRERGLGGPWRLTERAIFQLIPKVPFCKGRGLFAFRGLFTFNQGSYLSGRIFLKTNK